MISVVCQYFYSIYNANLRSGSVFLRHSTFDMSHMCNVAFVGLRNYLERVLVTDTCYCVSATTDSHSLWNHNIYQITCWDFVYIFRFILPGRLPDTQTQLRLFSSSSSQLHVIINNTDVSGCSKWHNWPLYNCGLFFWWCHQCQHHQWSEKLVSYWLILLISVI